MVLREYLIIFPFCLFVFFFLMQYTIKFYVFYIVFFFSLYAMNN